MKVQAAKKNCSAILLVFLVASTLPLLLPQPVVAATKPSAPEFSASYVDNSYYVEPVYGTDEFTGQTVIKQEGHTVDGKTIELSMKNQPFTTYNDSDGNVIDLYFNFRYKGHYGTSWSYYPFSESGEGTRRYSSLFFTLTDEEPQIPQSNTAFTTKNLTLAFLYGVYGVSVGDQIDFQVQAIIGHIDYWGDGYYKFMGEASDWSGTQIVTVGESTSVNTVTPAPTQTQPTGQNQTAPSVTNSSSNPTQSGTQQDLTVGFDWQTIVIVGLVAVVVLLAVVVVLQRKGNILKEV